MPWFPNPNGGAPIQADTNPNPGGGSYGYYSQPGYNGPPPSTGGSSSGGGGGGGGGAGGGGQQNPYTSDMSGLANYAAQTSGVTQAQLAQQKAEFDAQLAFEQQQLQQLGIPQVQINQYLAALQQQQFMSQVAQTQASLTGYYTPPNLSGLSMTQPVSQGPYASSAGGGGGTTFVKDASGQGMGMLSNGRFTPFTSWQQYVQAGGPVNPNNPNLADFTNANVKTVSGADFASLQNGSIPTGVQSLPGATAATGGSTAPATGGGQQVAQQQLTNGSFVRTGGGTDVGGNAGSSIGQIQNGRLVPFSSWQDFTNAGGSAAMLNGMPQVDASTFQGMANGSVNPASVGGGGGPGQPAGSQQTLQLGQLMGTFNGSPTEAAREYQQNFGLQQGQLTGSYNGAPTEAASEYARTLAEQQRQYNATLGLQQGQLGQQYLSTAAQLQGPQNTFQLSNYLRGAQGNQAVPTYINSLLNNTGMAAFQGTGSTAPTPQSAQGLLGQLTGGNNTTQNWQGGQQGVQNGLPPRTVNGGQTLQPSNTQTYDVGGMLPPGSTNAVNNTGQPEYVLTGGQLGSLAGGKLGFGQPTYAGGLGSVTQANGYGNPLAGQGYGGYSGGYGNYGGYGGGQFSNDYWGGQPTYQGGLGSVTQQDGYGNPLAGQSKYVPSGQNGDITAQTGGNYPVSSAPPRVAHGYMNTGITLGAGQPGGATSATPGWNYDQTLGAIGNIAQRGAQSLGPGALERLSPDELQAFGSGLGAAGYTLPSFLSQYQQSRVGQQAAYAPTSFGY